MNYILRVGSLAVKDMYIYLHSLVAQFRLKFIICKVTQLEGSNMIVGHF